tara:strand:+ start:172 stop:357 length:186 start_codon:yes stop_codon:yes gene_type:complete
VGADNWMNLGFKNACINLGINFNTITANSNLKDYTDMENSIFFFNAKYQMRGNYLKKNLSI